jgi:hypothetical protein
MIKMYIDYMAKGHELTEEMFTIIETGRDIILDNGEGWRILVGADETIDYEEGGETSYNMYSYDLQSMACSEEMIHNAVVFVVKGSDIRMDCSHIADWMGYREPCCSRCGFDEKGNNSGNKNAWRIAANSH